MRGPASAVEGRWKATKAALSVPLPCPAHRGLAAQTGLPGWSSRGAAHLRAPLALQSTQALALDPLEPRIDAT